MSTHVRSAATLTTLTVILLVMAVWGWSALTSPLPGKLGESVLPVECEPREGKAGDRVTTDDVTVSVFNAGGREGQAAETMDLLVDRGFDEGKMGNGPRDVRVQLSQIWTDDPDSEIVRLVAKHLGRTKIVKEDPLSDGVTILVGEDFKKLRKGPKGITLKKDTSFCGPTVS
ncbi:LytR C-terminal domain-containing protein [Nocardioides pacificus]